MEEKAESIEQLLEQLKGRVDRIDSVNILFLDLSSTCVGYTRVKVNFERRNAVFLNAGSLWIPKLDQVGKCGYIYNAICNYWNIIDGGFDYCVLEQYMINANKLMGGQIVIEIHGSVKAALSEIGSSMSYILPQAWRSELGIKKDKENNDWKEPTKKKVLEYVDVPEKIVNNLTMNERNTSSDLYDSLAISIAWLQKMNIRHLDFNNIKFQTHVGIIGNI